MVGIERQIIANINDSDSLWEKRVGARGESRANGQENSQIQFSAVLTSNDSDHKGNERLGVNIMNIRNEGKERRYHDDLGEVGRSVVSWVLKVGEAIDADAPDEHEDDYGQDCQKYINHVFS